MMHVMRILSASILMLFRGGTTSIVIGPMIRFIRKMVSTPWGIWMALTGRGRAEAGPTNVGKTPVLKPRPRPRGGRFRSKGRPGDRAAAPAPARRPAWAGTWTGAGTRRARARA